MQAAAVAQALDLPDDEIKSIRTPGLLHDIGMIGGPEAVIKKVETLTSSKMELIRSHCETGRAIIEPMQHRGPWREYVYEHHERWDGSGYPD